MPIDVTKAPATASPLWVIALFIALSEVTAGVAAATTNGTARLIFACFAVAFPSAVFIAFVWLLVHHAPKLYPPGQYSREITPEIYRAGISQTDYKVIARAVAKAVIPEIGENSGRPDREDALDQVAHRFEEAVEESSVFVTLTPPLISSTQTLQIPVTEETTVGWLLDAIYWAIQPAVKPFTYGKEWMLYDGTEGKGYGRIGTQWAEQQGLIDDSRPIVKIGIMPGSRLTVTKITGGIKVDKKANVPAGTITFRHGITGGSQQVEVVRGETVREAAERSGLIIAGSSFKVCDEGDDIVDESPALKYSNEVLSIEVTI